MEVSEKDIKKLNRNIEVLNEFMEKFTSFKYRFLLSVVTGVGGVIGATIVAAILFGILSTILQSLGGVPYLQQLIEEAGGGN